MKDRVQVEVYKGIGVSVVYVVYGCPGLNMPDMLENVE